MQIVFAGVNEQTIVTLKVACFDYNNLIIFKYFIVYM